MNTKEVMCEYCSNNFISTEYKKDKWKRYCSRTCVNEARHLPIEQRILSNCTWNGDCLEWNKSVDSSNYGIINYHHKVWKTHRLLWTIKNGQIPDGLVLLHSCDNTLCLNLQHLSIGTVADNVNDMARKDRHGKITIPKQEVLQIIERVKNGEKQRALATEYNCSPSTINRYIKGVRRNV